MVVAPFVAATHGGAGDLSLLRAVDADRSTVAAAAARADSAGAGVKESSVSADMCVSRW